MDPERLRSEMKARRERIDFELDLLEARMAASSRRAKRTAVAGSALAAISAIYNWMKRRETRRAR